MLTCSIAIPPPSLERRGLDRSLVHALPGLSLAPVDGRHDNIGVYAVAVLERDGLRAHLTPRPDPVLYVRDRGQARGAELVVDGPPDAVVHDDDLVTNVREMQRGRPATIAVATENQYLHYSRSLLALR